MEAVFEQKNLILRFRDNLVASRVKSFFDKAKDYTELKENYDEIILDIRNVKIIDSIGISFIISLYKTALSFSRKFKITGSNEDIMQLFKIMKLDEVLVIENS